MLTKKEREQLKAIAAALPDEPSEMKERVRITGAELLRLNPIAMDQKGKPVIRSKVYTVNKFKAVNHYKRMLKAYDHGGISAIEAYCDGVKERYDEQQKEKEKQS